MINKNDNPVEWSQLLYELGDAKEHIESLIDELTKSEDFDETDFGIALGHVYSHINRAWNSRNHLGDVSTSKFEEFSKIPTDIKPV